MGTIRKFTLNNRRNVVGFSIAIGLVASVSLSACATEETKQGPAPKPTKATSTASPSPVPISASPSATSIEQKSEVLASEKMDKSCEQILPYESIYAINSNWSMLPQATSALTRVGTQQIELGGISCELIHETTGAKVNVVVAKLTATSAQQLSQQMSQNSGEAFRFAENQTLYFSSTDGIGIAQLVDGKYWVTISSTTFLTPQDPAPYAFIVTQNLK